MSFKYYVIIWGGGGGHQMITFDYGGEGGGQKGPKCDYVIFEWSLICRTAQNTVAVASTAATIGASH